MTTPSPTSHFRCRKHRQPIQLLWQIAKTSDGDFAGRPIEGEHRKGIRPGGWIAENRSLPPGLYCQRCLEAGALEPISDYDEIDLQEAGLDDTPHIGLSAADFDLEDVWKNIKRGLSRLIIETRDTEMRPAKTDGRLNADARIDAGLRRAVAKKLRGADLYSHQVQAIEAALDGRDVVIETATASGKSLCYWIPVLNATLEDNDATALYIAPTNALAEDQLNALDALGSEPATHARPGTYQQYVRSIKIGSSSVVAGRYDGTIEKNEGLRSSVRKSAPRILITNPEMLHYGILPHHQRLWQHFLSNLKYIVIDELHVYKGMFGANFANIVRRVQRLTRHYGLRPQIIGCSASIGNPADLFSAITGRTDAILLPAASSGAPVRRQRRAILDLTRSKDAMSTLVKELMLRTVGKDKARTIAFMRSIPEVDQVFGYVSGELRRAKKGISNATVREYKREIPVDQKAHVTADLRSGATLGVITTTALQLGIDIGDLSVCIICKFPGSKAAFFQQAGRAGRVGESLVLFIADESPLDQHFVQRPDELLDATSEYVYLNPNHRSTVLKHLRCAAEELRLDPENDRDFWGSDIYELLDELASTAGMSEDGREVLVVRHPGDSAAEVPIRSLGFECTVRDETGTVVARPDVLRAMRRFHRYARFQIQDQAYEVTRLAINWQNREAEAAASKLGKLDYTTASVVRTQCTVLHSDESLELIFRARIERGPVRFTRFVDSYYRIPAGSGEPEFQHLGGAAPPKHELDTEGLWITFPTAILADLETQDHLPSVQSTIESMRLAAALMCSTDPDDIGVHVDSTNPALGYRAFLADSTAGGDGLTAHVYRNVGALLDGALRMLRDCPNCMNDPASRGCPRCVTTPWGVDADVCRQGAMLLLNHLRESEVIGEQLSKASFGIPVPNQGEDYRTDDRCRPKRAPSKRSSS
jgi:DEAD/DEAH box helicase domain-containing protein